MLLFNIVICDSRAMLVSCSMDAIPIATEDPERSFADQISAGGSVRVHCMLSSDWPSVRNSTDKHNAIE